MKLLLQTQPLRVQQLSYISEIPANSSSISRQVITCLNAKTEFLICSTFYHLFPNYTSLNCDLHFTLMEMHCASQQP